MFGTDQPELFPAAPAIVHPDPDRIRRRLSRILSEARAAETMPWDDNSRRLYEKIVPQMSLALPEPEAAQFVMEFEREMERLA
ncbi:MAG: hypothetical protein ABIQ30_10745 [Devosia sp.]